LSLKFFPRNASRTVSLKTIEAPLKFGALSRRYGNIGRIEAIPQFPD
jgi:hypothetical protein